MMESRGANSIRMGAIFLISPLFALIVALKNFSQKSNHIFIILFFALYGYTYIPIPSSDVENHLEYFQVISKYTLPQFLELLSNVYTGKGRNPDFYFEVMAYVVSRFTTDHKIFLFVIAIVYFAVLLKLMRYIYSLYKPVGHNKYFFIFFAGAFMVWNLSSGINGIRFPLAFMLFALGALKFVITKKKKYLLVAFLSVFVHFSLVFSYLFLIIYAIFGYPKKNIVLYSILIFAFAVSVSIGEFIQANVGILGQAVGNKMNAYTDDYFINLREEHLNSVNWYIRVNRFATYYFAIAVLLLSRLKSLKINFDVRANNLYGFAIIMLIQNFFSSVIVDSLSNRYYLLFNLFTLIYLFYLGSINTKNTFLVAMSRIYFVILALHILIILRADLYTVSPILLFGNFFLMFFTESTMSIQELLLG